MKAFGTVHILVNNAALYYDIDNFDTSFEYLQRVTAVMMEGKGDLLPKTLQTIACPAFANATTKYKLTGMLPQEIGREFNTLGAKAKDVEISQLVVTCKAEMEKIREQIQNIE